MATTFTLTGKAADLVGEDFAASDLTGYVEPSQDVVNEVDVNVQRYGRKPLSFAGDGTWTVELVGTGDLVQAYRVVIRTRDRTLGVKNVESGWFELTADTEFGEVVEAEALDVRTAAEFAAAAAASAAEAELIAGLTGEDAAVAALLGNESSETYAAALGIGGGGAGLPKIIVSRTSAYVAAAGEFVRGNVTSGGFTVTLPAGPAVGALVAVQKTDASANVLTAAPAGGGTINGDATATIVARYAGAVLEHLGGNAWTVVSLFSAVGPRGEAGPSGPAGTGGVNPAQAAGVTGRWYVATPDPGGGLSVQNIPAGRLLMGMPMIAQRDITIDQLGVYVQTSGPPGALLRVGIYLPINQTNPYELALGAPYATLLAGSDTGTTPTSGDPTTSPSRVKFTLTSPLVIAKGTAFCGGFAVQGGAGSVGVYCDANPEATSPYGSTDMLDGAAFATYASGVAAALPATYTPAAFGTVGAGGGVHFRRSA